MFRLSLLLSLLFVLGHRLPAREELQLANDRIKLVFDSANGNLLSAAADGITVSPENSASAVAIQLEGTDEFPGKTPMRLQSYRFPAADTLELVLASPEWEARVRYRLVENESAFSRSVRWTRLAGAPVRIEALRFRLTGIHPGAPATSFYTFPTRYPADEVPFSEMRRRKTTVNSWDVALPCVVLYNTTSHSGVAVHPVTLEDDFSQTLIEKEGQVTIESAFHARTSLKPGESLTSGDEYISLSNAPLNGVIAAVGRRWHDSSFRCQTAPAWSRGAVLYGSYAGGTDSSWMRDIGGLKNFTTFLLPRLEALGVDAIWFNPLNPGSYGITEYCEVDPRNGTMEDLANTVKEAKKRKMRVLLDMIPHGPTRNSRLGRKIVAENPEWVSRDRAGEMKSWWGGLCMDYAAPGWQAYISDVARFYMERCAVDSWRVDVAVSSPDNESPRPGLRPSQSRMYGALELLRTLRKTIKANDPEAILLGECGSVTHLSECDYIYDMHWGLTAIPDLHNRPAAEWCRAAKRFLSRQQAALPEGAVFGLMRFAENHDTCRADWRFGSGHARALIALNFLIPGMAFLYSDQDIGFGPMIARLSQVRKRPEFRNGTALYEEITTSDAAVFTFARQSGNAFSVVAINFSGEEKPLRLGLPRAFCRAVEVIAGAPVSLLDDELKFSIPPYDLRVVALDSEDAAVAPPRREECTTTPDAAIQPLDIQEKGTRYIIKNAHCQLEISNGFPTRLTDGENTPLLVKMELSQGKKSSSVREFLDFRSAADSVHSKLERTAAGARITFTGQWKNAPWQITYRLDNSTRIHIDFQMEQTLPEDSDLRLEFGFGKPREWFVAALEGVLYDWYFPTHPAGDMIPGRYARPGGILWDSSQNPLDPRNPCFAVTQGNTRLALLPELEMCGNAILRERSSSRLPGLNLNLATRSTGAQQRAGLTLELQPAAPLPAVTGTIPAAGKLTCESANLTIENAHYLLRLRRSRGGAIRALFAAGDDRPLITDSRIRTTTGLLPSQIDHKNSSRIGVIGSSEEDPEPDVSLHTAPGRTQLTYSGFLRLSYNAWKQPGRPLIAYRQKYELDDSRRILAQFALFGRVLPSETEAFASAVLTFPEVERILLEGKTIFPEAEAINQRFALLSGAEFREVTLCFRNGRKLHLAASEPFGGNVCNVFFLRSAPEELQLHFAFFDGVPTSTELQWKSFRCLIEPLND